MISFFPNGQTTKIGMAWIWLALILAISFVLRHEVWLIHPDAAWFAIVADKILTGDRLFHDVFEVNHPFVTILHMPIAWLKMVGLGLTTAAFVYFHVVILAAIGLSYRALKATNRAGRVGDILLWLLIFVALVQAGEDFGQKEHLALVLIGPFLILSGTRETRPVALSLFAAGLAAFALALKPQFLAVIGFVLMARAGVLRQFSIRLWLLEGFCLIFLTLFYGLSFWIWPEFIAVTRDFTLVFYNQTGKGFLFLLFGFLISGGLIPALIAIFFFWRFKRKPARADLLQEEVFFAAGIGFFVAYIHQAHGILYQAYPAAALFIIVAIQALERVEWERARRALATIVCAGGIFYCYISYAHSGKTWSETRATSEAQYLLSELEGKSVYVVSPLFEGGLPIGGLANWNWASRYPGHWMVTLMRSVRENSRDQGDLSHVRQLDALLQQVQSNSAADLKRNKPEYVICFRRDSEAPCLIQDFLLKNEDFAAEFRFYRPLKNFPLLTIYRRTVK